MNNTTEITLGGKKYPITFGMLANELFLGYQQDGRLPGGYKISIDLIYSGIENECILSRKPSPEYRDIAEAIEQIYSDSDEDGLKQIEKVFAVYNDSRAKKELDKIQENIKKKLSELNQPTTKK